MVPYHSALWVSGNHVNYTVDVTYIGILTIRSRIDIVHLLGMAYYQRVCEQYILLFQPKHRPSVVGFTATQLSPFPEAIILLVFFQSSIIKSFEYCPCITCERNDRAAPRIILYPILLLPLQRWKPCN